MDKRHPLATAPYIQIVRHANGAVVGSDVRFNSDRVVPSESTHVFTSFQEMTDFLKGWWPEAGKE